MKKSKAKQNKNNKNVVQESNKLHAFPRKDSRFVGRKLFADTAWNCFAQLFLPSNHVSSTEQYRNHRYFTRVSIFEYIDNIVAE